MDNSLLAVRGINHKYIVVGEIARLNEILVPLVKQGQSIHQIYLNNKDELMCSEKTLYNYVDGCLFDIRNIDLPRKVPPQI